MDILSFMCSTDFGRSRLVSSKKRWPKQSGEDYFTFKQPGNGLSWRRLQNIHAGPLFMKKRSLLGLDYRNIKK